MGRNNVHALLHRNPISVETKNISLISKFRRVSNVVFFILGDNPVSEFCADVSEHSVSSIFIGGGLLLTQIMNM